VIKQSRKWIKLLDEALLSKQLEEEAEIPQDGIMDDSLAIHLETAQWLKERKSLFDCRKGFVSTERQRLVAALAGESTPAWKRQPLAWQRTTARVVISFILVLSFFLLTSSVALAAQASTPGEGLYPIKTFVEDARLMLTFDRTRDTELQLKFAQEHLVECANLISDGRYDDALIALHNYDKYIIAASRSVRSIEDPQVASALSRSLSETLLQNSMIIGYLITDMQ
jgi:hypothetical protein